MRKECGINRVLEEPIYYCEFVKLLIFLSIDSGSAAFSTLHQTQGNVQPGKMFSPFTGDYPPLPVHTPQGMLRNG